MTDALMLWPNGDPPRKRRAHWEGGRGGYAAEPGTGPAGETCGTCQHHHVRSLSRDYHKCEIGGDSGGPGTDIRVRAPACQHWVAPCPSPAAPCSKRENPPAQRVERRAGEVDPNHGKP